MKRNILLIGAYIGLVTLGIYWYSLNILNYTIAESRTMAFATIILLQLFHAFNCRSIFESAFSKIKITSPVILTVLGSIVVQIGIMYWPVTQKLFEITELQIKEIDLVLLLGASVVAIEEVRKWFVRKTFK